MTDREIMEALLAGKKLRARHWGHEWLQLNELGEIVDERGEPSRLGWFDDLPRSSVEIAP